MTRARLTFVLQDALGWKTYRHQLSAVLEARDDIHFQFIAPVPLPRWRRALIKHPYMRPSESVYRKIDPIKALQGLLGEKIRAEIAEFKPSALYFGGHWLAATVSERKLTIPYTVATDHTRASMERSLTAGIWTPADLEREVRLFQGAAHVFPMSEWTARSVRDDCRVEPGRITVMPPSINLARFVRPSYLDQGPLRLIFIGNDFLRKGGDKLCRWVAGPLAGRAELHVVSGDRDAQGERPGVIFHGRVPNDRLVGELLPSMDALCHPTKSDMSPLVVIEAAAAGLPAVASRIGAISEIIREGETGFLVDPEDEAGFIAALGRLAEEPGLRRAMGERAWEYARQKFDASANYNALIDYLIALGRRGAAG